MAAAVAPAFTSCRQSTSAPISAAAHAASATGRMATRHRLQCSMRATTAATTAMPMRSPGERRSGSGALTRAAAATSAPAMARARPAPAPASIRKASATQPRSAASATYRMLSQWTKPERNVIGLPAE